jgi:hypothetical protein
MAHGAGRAADERLVERLIRQARELLEAAASGVEAGLGAGEWTAFIGPEGGLEMIAGAGEPVESLRWSRGALAAWKVTRQDGGLRVEGFDGDRRCLLELPVPHGLSRRLLGDSRMYVLGG